MFEQETSPTQTRRFMGFWLTELELNIAGKSRQGFLPAPRPQCTGVKGFLHYPSGLLIRGVPQTHAMGAWDGGVPVTSPWGRCAQRGLRPALYMIHKLSVLPHLSVTLGRPSRPQPCSNELPGRCSSALRSPVAALG